MSRLKISYSRPRLFPLIVAIILLSASVLTLRARRAHAAANTALVPLVARTLIVTNTNDSGPGSLRDALSSANSDFVADTINITATGTITLQSELPALSDTGTTINGPGADSLRIRRAGTPGVFSNVPLFSILTVNIGVVASINGVTISHGWSAAGAGIRNSGLLTVSNCVISDSLADGNGNSDGNGGGILIGPAATLTLTNTAVSNNKVVIRSANKNGGGLFNQGQLTLTGVTVSANSAANGGGIYNSAGGATTMNNTIVDGNSAPGFGRNGLGGGIFNGGLLTLSTSTISNNTATLGEGGGLAVTTTSDAVTVTDSTIKNNSANVGGGIAIDPSAAAAQKNFERVTVSGNSANSGGGVYNGGTVTVLNCTVSNNSGNNGGGFWTAQDSTTAINQSTVTANTGNLGAGVFCFFGPVTAHASIISGNTGPGAQPDIFGTVNSQDFNLFGVASGVLQPHDLIASDPHLAPLGNYGGTLQTHALMPDSLALDHGPATDLTTTDERGLPRVADGNGDGNSVADIGAFEEQKYVVTNINNSGAGSLRQALIDNNAAGGALVTFNIPGSGIHTIAPTSSTLLEITKPVHVDGYTQPGATRNSAGSNANLLIELSGATAGFGSTGINLMAGYSVIEGLVINRFNSDSGIWINGGGAVHNRISGNRIGTDVSGTTSLGNAYGILISSASSNVIGTNADGIGDLAEGNLLSGNSNGGVAIFESDSSQNVIAGNYIGTDAAGLVALGNLGSGVLLNGAHDNLIGGASAPARNVIAGNIQAGVDCEGAGTNNNRIIGNFIGTNRTGAAALANGVGVHLFNGSGNHVGDAAAGEGNVISGNRDGVIIGSDGAAGNFVQGNLIGIAADGTSPLGNSSTSGGNGVGIIGSNGNLIGDPAGSPGASNHIANNSAQGVFVASGSGNSVRGNSIVSNGALGIDLGAVGLTPNDDGDADSGANNLQNFPALNSALYDGYGGSSTEVTGTLNSTPNTTFNLEIFASQNCDASGHGEGQTLIGTGLAATDALGNAHFIFNFTTADLLGQSLTATATDPAGNTSEFSSCLAVTPATRSVQFTATNFSVVEGNTVGILTVARTGSTGGAVTVNYTTANGAMNPATGGQACGAPGVDYVNSSGTLSWAANELSNKTINVPICNDTLAESSESISVTLSSTTGGASLGAPAIATLTIQDNDDPGQISFGNSSYSAVEGSGVATVNVVRNAVDSGPVSVQYATVSGGTGNGGLTCGATGVDFVNAGGTLTWAAGDVTPKSFTITLCDNQEIKPDKTVSLALNNPTGGASLGTPGTAMLTIVNDDYEFIVTNTNDNGPGSLRQAIASANLNQAPGINKISFAAGLTGVINLATELPALTANISIRGPGANLLTVRRSSVPGTPEFRIFHINPVATVSLFGLTIANGTIDDGAGIFNEGTADISGCSIESNTATDGGGGGIDNSGHMTLTNSTVAGNTSLFVGDITGGGGIYNSGELQISGSTISGNGSDPSGFGFGGGIFNEGNSPLSIAYSTISANNATYPGIGFLLFSRGGGGIYQRPFATYKPTIKNSIIAGNSCPNAPDISGDVVSRDYNLIGNTVGATITGDTGNNITNVDARLAPLANNGGPTRTHALLVNSPAIDAGTNQDAPNTDQRGLPRIADGNSDGSEIIDIGAFEVQSLCSMVFLNETVPAGVAGASYHFPFEISGGTTPYNFGLTSGVLPTGLALSADGILFGIPTQPGSFPFEVTVSDSKGCSRRRSYTLVINCPTITIEPESLPGGSVRAAYPVTSLTAAGGSGPYTFTVEGSLPPGLTLADGTLSGTPTQAGQFHFQITATDSNGCMASQNYAIQITAAPACASDVTSLLTITRGGFSQNLVTRRFRQTVTIRNDGSTTIAGPLVYAVDNLSGNATLYGPSGTTNCAGPISPYLNVAAGEDNQLTSGESVTIVLEFNNSNTRQSITYVPRLLSGSVR